MAEKYLSPRNIANYCQVNFKTVLKWIADGKLKSYKLPGSGINRVQEADLLDFLKRFALPIPDQLQQEGKCRILIVDDEIDAVDTLRRLLRSDEFEIEAAHDGFEAGRKVEAFKPQIMLLDLRMPGMGGREVLREMKSNEKTRAIRIIILSGYVAEDESQQLIQAGADGILEKPVERESLLRMIGVETKKKGVVL